MAKQAAEAAKPSVAEAQAFFSNAPGGEAYEREAERHRRVLRASGLADAERRKRERAAAQADRLRAVVAALGAARDAFGRLTPEELSRTNAELLTVRTSTFGRGHTGLPQFFANLGRAIESEQRRLAELEAQAGQATTAKQIS